MSDKVEKFTSGPEHFTAQRFFSAMTLIYSKVGVPFLDTHEEIVKYDTDRGRPNCKRVKITFEIVEDEQPAHEHLKEEANA